jgi:hypothetical protein
MPSMLRRAQHDQNDSAVEEIAHGIDAHQGTTHEEIAQDYLTGHT